MGKADWTEAFLTAKRAVGDRRTDALERELAAAGQSDALDRLMLEVLLNGQIPADLPGPLQAFLRETEALPSWADPAVIQKAELLFNAWGLPAMAALVGASLPECYTMRTGVRILALTRQLGAHTNRRLHQTAAMIIAVMGVGGLQAGGRGIVETQKVRLIHAAIRRRILTRTEPGMATREPSSTAASVADVITQRGLEWDVDRDGWPINQEDQAFTLLTFGYVIPRAMRTLGVPLTDEDCAAFIHAWNVVGFVLGVDEDLMAWTYADAEDLFARIKAGQGGLSPAGTLLTDSLLGAIENDLLRARVLHPLAPILVRMLVGDETAKMLGMNARHGQFVTACHRVVVRVVRLTNVFEGPLLKSRVGLRLSAWLGSRLVADLASKTYRQAHPEVRIPEGWG